MNNLKPLILAVVIAAALNGANCVKGSHIASLSIVPATRTSMAINTTLQLVAIATFTDGSIFNFSQVVEWTSSDKSVATVDDAGAKGLVTAVTKTADQTTTITARDTVNHVEASIDLTVTTPLTITVTPANPHMSIGAIHQFQAIATFADNTTQDLTSY